MSFLKVKKIEPMCNQPMCRVCLDYTENPNSIYEPRPTAPDSDINIVDEIYFCTNLEIEENSRFLIICEDCLVKLTIAVDFKKQCHSAQRVLENESFDQEKPTDDEFIESYEEEDVSIIEDTDPIKETKIKKLKKTPGLKKIKKIENIIDDEEEPTDNDFEITGNNKLMAKNGRLGTNCPECDKIIYTQTGLDLHLRIHRDERNFECEICFKKFRQKGAMLRHMDIHSNARKYKCEICNRGFNDQTSLRAHSFTHSTEQTHKCHICEKTFKYQSSYAYHMQAHNNDRKHQCDQCDAAFIRPLVDFFFKLLVVDK